MPVKFVTPEEWDQLGLPRQTVVFGTGRPRRSAPSPSSATATSNIGMTSMPPYDTSGYSSIIRHDTASGTSAGQSQCGKLAMISRNLGPGSGRSSGPSKIAERPIL